MRTVYKNFTNTKASEAEGNEDIEVLAENIEATALNDTLDKIHLKITVNQQVGATAVNISDPILITNLKDLVKKNDQDQFQILFDTKPLLMTGSLSSVSNSSVVYTSYELIYKKNFIYKDAVEKCFNNQTCSQIFVNEAKVRNDIHNEIWSNTSTTTAEKEIEEQRFSKAYLNKEDSLYEYYHKYFTDKVNITKVPVLPDDYMDVDGKLVTYVENGVKHNYVNPKF